MKVLIVAKTHMAGAFCIGGLARDTNQNIRLLQADGLQQPVDTPYEVGQVWEIEFTPSDHIRPPHLEDVLVSQHVHLGKVSNIKGTLLDRVPVWRGEVKNIFEGLIQLTEARSGYISAKTGVPTQSVGFWLIDRTLTETEYRQKVRYYTADYSLKIPYVGVAEPVDQLQAGTLLRVSLSRWWAPYDKTNIEERCYLQLSGWYS